MSDRIFTRAYSSRSAGGLCSGRRPTGPRLTPDELLSNFNRHRFLGNRVPTALVSVSDRIVDTLQRAFNKHYEGRESPEQIWIVFIRIPGDRVDETIIHSAKELAETCQHPKPFLLAHEFLFEWAIPEKYVDQIVSVRTLMDRGLTLERHIDSDTGVLPQVLKLREAMANEYFPDKFYSGDVEMGFLFFVQYFGARAPSSWIAHQLYHELFTFVSTPHEQHRVKDKIDITLGEWWLQDVDLLQDWEEHYEWREMEEEVMVGRWIDFWIECQDCDVSRIWYESTKDRLVRMERRLYANIEAAAINIGLNG